MKRILIVQTAFVGDVVLTTPLIREVRRAHADAALTVLATPAGLSLLRGLPQVDGFLSYDKKGVDAGLSGFVGMIGRLREERFDLGIAAQRSFRTGMLLLASRIPRRIGFAGSPGARLCNVKVPWKGNEHAVHRYLALSGPSGGSPGEADPRPLLAVSGHAVDKIETLLTNAGIDRSEPLLCIAPGSVWGTKRWITAGYAEMIRRAARIGLRVVLAGSPEERELCLEVNEEAGSRALVLAGDISLPDLVALLDRVIALICNDSGPAHIATAVNTPVVAIFGPTVPAFGYTPYGEATRVVERSGLECRPCHHHGPRVCPLAHFRCMQEIEPDAVWSALEELVPLKPGGRSQ